MESGQEKWKSIYEFDTPVVRSIELRWIFPMLKEQIHVEKSGAEERETKSSALKLMHRVKEEDVVRLMDEAERT